jgi:hypothetical protein
MEKSSSGCGVAWFLSIDLKLVIKQDAFELVAANQIGIAGHMCF